MMIYNFFSLGHEEEIMTRAYNFCAGPAAIPEPVLQTAKEELLNWGQIGASIMEMSHRSEAFLQIASEAEQDLRDLMHIPDNFSNGQFFLVAGNKNGNLAILLLWQQIRIRTFHDILGTNHFLSPNIALKTFLEQLQRILYYF